MLAALSLHINTTVSNIKLFKKSRTILCNKMRGKKVFFCISIIKTRVIIYYDKCYIYFKILKTC